MLYQVELFSRGKWRRTPMAFGSESAADAWIAGRGNNWRVRPVAVGLYTPPKPTKEFLAAEGKCSHGESGYCARCHQGMYP